MFITLNFASEGYESARQLNTKTAYRHGADKVYEFSIEHIDSVFFERNKQILQQKRGCGYWLWKPYFINKVLLDSKENDWIIYADSGMYYRTDIPKFIDKLEKKNIHMISRATKFQEKQYTKRDLFVEMNCDIPEYTDTLQRAASVILVKNTKENRQIIGEWLDKAQNMHWITDEINTSGKENYPEFIDHRHDQSIFSLVCKKYGVPYNRNLFLDMAIPVRTNALLVDHHSKCGNRITAYIATIQRAVMMILIDMRRSRKGKAL